MTSFEQLRAEKKLDPVATFEGLFRDALESLVRDLAACPWYVREREVVNMFVFEHLIPRFQDEKLDIGQIGIEIPVLKCCKPKSLDAVLITKNQPKQAIGRYADIVVWPHSRATRSRTCRPLVQIEWKNISSKEGRATYLNRQHEEDVRILQRDREFVCASYAVLTDQRNMRAEVRSKKIFRSGEAADFFYSRCEAKYTQNILADVPDFDRLPTTAQGSALHDDHEGCDPKWLPE